MTRMKIACCELCGWNKPPFYRHIVDYENYEVMMVCKRCHHEIHGIRFKLLEIFRDYEVYVEGKSQFGRYRALYKVVPIPRDRPLTVEDLKGYVENLRSRFPDKNFVLQKRRVGDREFWVITKLRLDANGNVQHDIVPLYFDLDAQKVYVPKKVVEKMPKLANYIIMVTLSLIHI